MTRRSTLSRFTLLTNKQRRLFAVGFIAGVVMVLNTVYLLLSSHVAGIGKDPEVLPIMYQLMLLLHLTLGIGFVSTAIIFVFLHIRKVYNRRNRRPWMRTTGGALIVSLLLLMLTGFFILSESNSRENFWVFVSHQTLAALMLAGYLTHRFLSRVKPNMSGAKKGAVFAAVAMSTVALIHFIETGALDAEAETREAATGDSVYVGGPAPEVSDALAMVEKRLPFKAAGDADADSVFFPALTTTSTREFLPARVITHDDLPDLEAFRAETEEKGFAPSYYLGAQSCERCHADIVAQWSTSAHRFSSFNNPFYRKSVELTRDKISKKSSQFCGGCHDPAVMLAGNMVKEIDPLTPESQAGLTCLSCHAIDGVHGVTGNGNYNIHDKTESPYIFDQAKHGIGQYIHDYLLKAKPTVHKERMFKPVFKKSEFCMPCHKVNLDVTVNNYRWLRGQNEYDAWHNSGVAHNQPKTWYEPPTVKQCQDCHMPLEEAVHGDVAADDGKVRSHRFISVNTALPALRGDTETIRMQEADLRDNKLRLEIFAVRSGDGTLTMSARDHNISVKPGEKIQVDVVVRNVGVGHTFPGGTNDSNEGWIDFKASLDAKPVFHNGWLDKRKHVDPAAHFYKAVIVDRHGERIAKRNASDIYATVYGNVIPPSTSDIARYRFTVPRDAEGKQLTINARLMWRKFNQEYTEFVFEGQEIPDLPITEVETDTITVNVSSTASTVAVSPLPEDAKRWMRYNDYGIGSVLDKDTRTALAAFSRVKELVPERMDGPLNLGRANLMAGNLSKAEEMLRLASKLAPDQPRLAFFWGRLLEKSGRLDESIKAYQRTLQSYPKSRDTWARLGRVFWLAGKPEESVKAYLQVLEIDPEHAQAYHQLNLAYKAMAAKAQDNKRKQDYLTAAAEFQRAFEKYKIDEDAATVTHIYREKNPHDNRMSQTIVIHEEG